MFFPNLFLGSLLLGFTACPYGMAAETSAETPGRPKPSEVLCSDLLAENPPAPNAPFLTGKSAEKVFWTIQANRRGFLIWLGNELGYETAADFYRLALPEIKSHGGYTMLKYHERENIATTVTQLLSEIDFLIWEFPSVPPGHFQDAKNRMKYIQWFEREMKIQNPQDWYKVTVDEVLKRHGGWAKTFYRKNKESMRLGMARESFPAFRFDAMEFVDKNGNRANGYWNSWWNQQKYLAELEEKLGFWSTDCWYDFATTDLTCDDAGIVMRVFGGLVATARARYPWYDYKEWLFSGNVPDGFWKEAKNRKAYLTWLEGQMRIKGPEGWYQVTKEDFVKYNGGGLLQDSRFYGHDVSRAAKELYPEFDFKPWLFARGVPDAFWKTMENRLLFWRWYEQQVGYQGPEDWYDYDLPKIRELGGGGLMAVEYGFTRSKLLTELYPDYPFLPWLFPAVDRGSTGSWSNLENQRDFMDWASDIWGFHSPEDWYDRPASCIKALPGGVTLLGYYQGSLADLLTTVYPDMNWQKEKFQARLKTQKWMLYLLRKIYPALGLDEFVWEETPSEFLFTEANNYSLDVHIPKLKLGFEYQGEQHYAPTNRSHMTPDEFAEYVRRDAVKRDTATKEGIRLIEVPWSWDGTQSQLEQMINLGPHAWQVGDLTELSAALEGVPTIHPPIDYRKIKLVRRPRALVRQPKLFE
jgi:hypothetical protein